MKRTAGIIALVAALAACLFAFGCAGEAGSAESAITVSADATVPVEPDKASIGVTLAASGDTSDAAKAAAKGAADAAVASLKAKGAADSDIKVSEITLKERYEDGGTKVESVPTGYYDWYGNWIDTGTQEYTTYVGQVLVGYDATVHVAAVEFDASALGQVVRDCAAAGATGFDGLAFIVSDKDAAYQQALAAAVEAAHAKAESLAQASGVYVGRVVNLVEDAAPAFETTVAADASVIKVGDESTFDIAPVPVSATAAVTVSYAIS